MGKIGSYPAAGGFEPGDVLIGNHGGVTSTFGPAAIAAGLGAAAAPPPSRLVNAWFDVWQGGAAFHTLGDDSAYAADQWWFCGNQSRYDVTRGGFAKGQAAVPGDPAHYLQVERTRTVISLIHGWLSAIIEGAAAHAGRTVTISFWAMASEEIELVLSWIQKFGTGGSPSMAVGAQPSPAEFQVGTQWARHALTIAVPGCAGKGFGANGDDHVELRWSWRDDEGGASAWLRIAAVQIDIGAEALPERRPDPGEEWRRCRRFYRAEPGGFSEAGDTVAKAMTLLLPEPMRAVPTVSIEGGDVLQAEFGTLHVTAGSVATVVAPDAPGPFHIIGADLVLDARIAP